MPPKTRTKEKTEPKQHNYKRQLKELHEGKIGYFSSEVNREEINRELKKLGFELKENATHPQIYQKFSSFGKEFKSLQACYKKEGKQKELKELQEKRQKIMGHLGLHEAKATHMTQDPDFAGAETGSTSVSDDDEGSNASESDAKTIETKAHQVEKKEEVRRPQTPTAQAISTPTDKAPRLKPIEAWGEKKERPEISIEQSPELQLQTLQLEKQRIEIQKEKLEVEKIRLQMEKDLQEKKIKDLTEEKEQVKKQLQEQLYEKETAHQYEISQLKQDKERYEKKIADLEKQTQDKEEKIKTLEEETHKKDEELKQVKEEIQQKEKSPEPTQPEEMPVKIEEQEFKSIKSETPEQQPRAPVENPPPAEAPKEQGETPADDGDDGDDGDDNEDYFGLLDNHPMDKKEAQLQDEKCSVKHRLTGYNKKIDYKYHPIKLAKALNKLELHHERRMGWTKLDYKFHPIQIPQYVI